MSHDGSIVLQQRRFSFTVLATSVIFSTYFAENQLIHHHNTRHKCDFHTHFVHTEFGKRSIKYKGCKLWNNLPDDIKAIRSCCSFKVKLKKLLLQLLEWMQHFKFVFVCVHLLSIQSVIITG